jgi:hypothetical protein
VATARVRCDQEFGDHNPSGSGSDVGTKAEEIAAVCCFESYHSNSRRPIELRRLSMHLCDCDKTTTVLPFAVFRVALDRQIETS